MNVPDTVDYSPLMPFVSDVSSRPSNWDEDASQAGLSGRLGAMLRSGPGPGPSTRLVVSGRPRPGAQHAAGGVGAAGFESKARGDVSTHLSSASFALSSVRVTEFPLCERRRLFRLSVPFGLLGHFRVGIRR